MSLIYKARRSHTSTEI